MPPQCRTTTAIKSALILLIWHFSLVEITFSVSHNILILGGICENPNVTAQLYTVTDCRGHSQSDSITNITSNSAANLNLNSFPKLAPKFRIAMAVAVTEINGHQSALLTGGYLKPPGDATEKLFSNSTQVLDLKLWKLTELKAMKAHRAYHSMIVYRDMLYVCGGFNKEEKFLITCERYMIKYDQWFLLEKGMPHATSHHAAVTMGHQMLLIGGMNFGIFSSNKVVQLDLHSHKWQSLPSMVYERNLPVATVVNGNKVLVCGGQNPTMSFLRSCETWNKGERHWKLHPEMLQSPRFGAFMLQIPDLNQISESNQNKLSSPKDFMILVGGGKLGPSQSLDSVTCFHPKAPNILEQRISMMRTRLANGCYFASAILLPPVEMMKSPSTARRDVKLSNSCNPTLQRCSAIGNQPCALLLALFLLFSM